MLSQRVATPKAGGVQRLMEWDTFYNYHRPHGAFAGKTPYEALRERLQCPPRLSDEVCTITRPSGVG